MTTASLTDRTASKSRIHPDTIFRCESHLLFCSVFFAAYYNEIFRRCCSLDPHLPYPLLNCYTPPTILVDNKNIPSTTNFDPSLHAVLHPPKRPRLLLSPAVLFIPFIYRTSHRKRTTIRYTKWFYLFPNKIKLHSKKWLYFTCNFRYCCFVAAPTQRIRPPRRRP